MAEKIMQTSNEMVNSIVNSPTPEMANHFFNRTSNHIEYVKEALLKVSDHFDLDKASLLERGKNHDISKYSPFEQVPYIFLSWKYKIEQEGKTYDYPEGMEERVRKATKHHITHNRHHPEFYEDPNDMKLLDIVEMFADWGGMSTELGTSLKKWIKENTFTKYNWNQTNINRINNLLSIFKELK